MQAVKPIGIDARAAAEVPAGRGRYVRELLLGLERIPEASKEKFVLYGREPWGDLDPDRFRWSLIDSPDPLWHLRAARRANRETRAFHSTNSYLTTWFTSVPAAVTVHDLVPFIDGAQSQARAARIERATIKRSLRRSKAFVCVSNATRVDLERLFPKTAGRTRVTPLAAAGSFFEAPNATGHQALSRPYVLAVGTLEPRKNLERLLDAWISLDENLRDEFQLALVGPRGWDDENIVAKARSADSILLGRVSEEELHSLYAGATVFAYPSLYEGFGLPTLEAMAAGAPVLTSSISSLPEVVGGAGVTVDPYDIDAIAEGLSMLLTEPAIRRSFSERGRHQAAEFSWDRTARETLRVLRAL